MYLPESDVYWKRAAARSRAVGRARAGRGIRRHSDLWLVGPELTVRLTGGFDTSIKYFHGKTSSYGRSQTTSEPKPSRSESAGAVDKAVSTWRRLHPRHRSAGLADERSDRASKPTRSRLRGAWSFTPFVSLEVGYDFQTRPDDVKVQRARAGLTFRF